MEWRNSKTDPPPQDGKPIWAHLYDSGIRKLRWESAEDYLERRRINGDPKEYNGWFVEVNSPDEYWSPQWWLPYDAIPEPPQ